MRTKFPEPVNYEEDWPTRQLVKQVLHNKKKAMKDSSEDKENPSKNVRHSKEQDDSEESEGSLEDNVEKNRSVHKVKVARGRSKRVRLNNLQYQ
jgi:5-methylcytosine-specific restriction endonuclease McrA